MPSCQLNTPSVRKIHKLNETLSYSVHRLLERAFSTEFEAKTTGASIGMCSVGKQHTSTSRRLEKSQNVRSDQWDRVSACVHPRVSGPLPPIPHRRGAAVNDLIQDARIFWARVSLEATPPPGSVHSRPLKTADQPGEVDLMACQGARTVDAKTVQAPRLLACFVKPTVAVLDAPFMG